MSADTVRIIRIDEARRELIEPEMSWCVRFRVKPRWPSAAWRKAFQAQLQQPVPAGRRALYGFTLVCTRTAPEPYTAAHSSFGMRLRRALHRLRSRTEIQVICPAGAEHLRMARAQLVTLVRLTNQAVAAGRKDREALRRRRAQAVEELGRAITQLNQERRPAGLELPAFDPDTHRLVPAEHAPVQSAAAGRNDTKRRLVTASAGRH